MTDQPDRLPETESETTPASAAGDLQPRRLRRVAKAGDVAAVQVMVDALECLDVLEEAARILARVETDGDMPVMTAAYRRFLELTPADGSADGRALDLTRLDRKALLPVAAEVFGAGADHPLLARLALEAAMEAGERDRAVALGAALLARRPITLHHIVAANSMFRIGLGAMTQTWIETVEQSGELHSLPEEVLRRFGEVAAYRRGDLATDSLIIVRERPGSRRVLFAFCNLNQRFGVGNEALLDTLADVDAHVAILLDPHGLIYLKGAPALGDDMSATAQGMKDLAARLGADEILCAGTSAGGYAALRYGLLAGASRVIAFGGLTLLTAERCRVRADGRAAGIGQRLVDEAEDQLADCRPLLEARQPPMGVELYYGEKMPQDRFQAEHLAGAPGVILHPMPDVGTHAVVANLTKTGQFDAIMRAFVERS